MRTAGIVVVALLFVAVGLLVSMSGLGQVYDRGYSDTSGPSDQFNDTANQSPADDGNLSGDVGSNDGDQNIIGFLINGASGVLDAVKFVATLPIQLNQLGLPWYAAYPVGAFIEIVAGIGFVQFVTGREYL